MKNNLIKLYITDDDKNKVQIDFFNISKKNNKYHIYVKNILGNAINELKKGSSWYFSDGIYLLTSFTPNKTVDLTQKKEINFIASNCKEIESNNYLASLIYSWNLGEENYTWRDLKSDMFRKIWLDTSLNFKGIRKNLASNNIILDLSSISTIIEMYCHLGEACLGYGGYMGSNLDALDDCLSQLENPEKYTFTFKGVSKFENNIKDNKKYEGSFFNMFLETFKDNSIKIIE